LAHVLLLATRYDSISRFTHRWATNLERILLSSGLGHTVSSYYGPAVSAATLATAPGADYLLFFGHGEPDRLIAQRGWLSLGSGPTLVDTTTVGMLGGHSVYAVCCQAGILLGPAHSSMSPTAEFVGYKAPFGFSFPNAADFESVVNPSAIALINGSPAKAVCDQLRQEWHNLADDFPNGSRRSRRDAFLAGYAAATNSAFVSVNP
jgi:hypothetical protein